MVTSPVRRGPLLFLALLLAGCPDDVGKGLQSPAGLVAPADLIGVPNGGSQIKLSWSDRAMTETGYRLEMNFSPFGSPFIAGLQILPANTTSWVFPSFPNTTYYFRVVAITPVMESDPSAVVVVTTPDVPVQPTGVTATTETSQEITVTWQDVSGETGYRIERSSDGGSTWVFASAVSAGVTQCRSSGLIGDTEYAHRVVAINALGDSTPSDPALALTATDAMQILSDPYAGDAGRFTSCAFIDGPLFRTSHYDIPNRRVVFSDLLVDALRGPVLVDAGPTGAQDVGGTGTSTAIDRHGLTHIVAQDVTDATLRYITNGSRSMTALTIDAQPPATIGAKPRIACDRATDTLHAFYQSRQGDGTVLARYAQKLAGGTWTSKDLTSVPLKPESVLSLALDASGTAHFLLVQRNNTIWHFRMSSPGSLFPAGEEVPGPGSADHHSLAIDSAGVLYVAYQSPGAHALMLMTRVTTEWTFEPIHSAAGLDLGAYCSIVIHPPTGRLHVAYYDATNKDLRYARKDPGGAWVLRIIDAAGDVGSHLSMTLDDQGRPFIAYRDETNRRLKVAYGAP